MEPVSRQRVSIACMACRAKRMRCDGKEPVCGGCAKRSLACVYQHADNKRRPPSKKYVESLQARIRHLESELLSVQTSRTFPSEGPGISRPERGQSEANSKENNECDGNKDDPLSELTGLIGRLVVVDDGQLHYFGSQSSLNLPKQPRRPAAVLDPWVEMQTQGLAAAAQLDRLTCASPELEEHLLELYWRWQNPWNHIVHKGAFLRSRRGLDDGRYCSPLLLSAIFAISARYSDRIELRTVADDPSTAGNAFCEQAKILLLYESEAPTVTTVQAAAILALRIMSDGKESLGWLYCGNATRMAHNLGLHMDCQTCVTSGLIPEDDAEVRKVTWWGCFLVDKLFASGLGRPSSIQKSSITCPKPNIDPDDEYNPWPPKSGHSDGATSLGAHSRAGSTSHFVSECMAIASEALEMIYAPNSELSDKDVEGIVTKADLDLRAYYNTLPSHLRLPSSPRISTLPHIYLSHIQYHAHLILLHKPLIRPYRGGRPETGDSVDSEAENTSEANFSLDQHMEICRHSAAQISKLMYLYKQHYTLRQIPIAAVHLSYAAAIIHLIDARPTNPNRDQAIRHLQTLVDALKDLRVPWCAWADRSLRGINLLALDWYRCDEIFQVKESHDLPDNEASSSKSTAGHKNRLEANGNSQGVYVVSSSPRNGETDLHPVNELQQYLRNPRDPSLSPTTASSLAFLLQPIDAGTIRNNTFEDWPAYSEFDWLQTEFGNGYYGSTVKTGLQTTKLFHVFNEMQLRRLHLVLWSMAEKQNPNDSPMPDITLSTSLIDVPPIPSPEIFSDGIKPSATTPLSSGQTISDVYAGAAILIDIEDPLFLRVAPSIHELSRESL